MVLYEKSSQEYQFHAGFLEDFIFSTTPFLLYINELPDDVICNVAIYADDSTLCSKSDQASYLQQQLELASEYESTL